MYASLDGACVFVRLVAAVSCQLHVPSGSVRVWGVRVLAELWGPCVQLLYAPVSDGLRGFGEGGVCVWRVCVSERVWDGAGRCSVRV